MHQQFPAGPKGLKTLRQLREPTAERLRVMQEISHTYGDITHLQFLNQHFYLLNRPELIRHVLIEAAEQFHSMPIGASKTKKSLDPEVVKFDRAFHRMQRRLLQPAFTPKNVAKYADTMIRYAADLTQSWKAGEVRDIANDMTDLTLRIVARTLFDADVSDRANMFGDAIHLGSAFLAGGDSAPIWWPTRDHRKLWSAWLGMDGAIKRVIAERRASKEDRGDLLSTILLATDDEGGGQLTEKQAHGTVMGLFIAGHETTSNALIWAWMLLAQSPEVAVALRAELDRVLAGRRPTLADLDQLPYTGWVIREAMRLYPPAYVITRYAVEDTTLEGYTVPKGSMLFMSPWVMHLDARFFDQPDRFMPERWANDLEKRLPGFAYFPFGGGAHVCIGQFFAMQEAELILATIAQRYDLTLQPDQHIQPQPMITLRPDKPVLMQVTPRE